MQYEFIPIIMYNKESKEQWICGLRALIASVRAASLDPLETWLRIKYLELTDNHRHLIGRKALQLALKHSGAAMPMIHKRLKRTDIPDITRRDTILSDQLPFVMFKTMYMDLQARTDLADVFVNPMVNIAQDDYLSFDAFKVLMAPRSASRSGDMLSSYAIPLHPTSSLLFFLLLLHIL